MDSRQRERSDWMIIQPEWGTRNEYTIENILSAIRKAMAVEAKRLESARP